MMAVAAALVGRQRVATPKLQPAGHRRKQGMLAWADAADMLALADVSPAYIPLSSA